MNANERELLFKDEVFRIGGWPMALAVVDGLLAM